VLEVTYEINVYTDDAQAMNAIYTELHREVLDVFNEPGVQIMTRRRRALVTRVYLVDGPGGQNVERFAELLADALAHAHQESRLDPRVGPPPAAPIMVASSALPAWTRSP
jgi:hypothetical protein